MAVVAPVIAWAAANAGTIAAATSVATGALSAYGAIQAGQQQAAMDRYNAQVEQVNAQSALNQAAGNAALQGQKTQREEGEMAASYGAAGVDASGTPADVMSDQAVQGDLARRTALYSGKMQFTQDQAQAAMDNAQASAASSSGWMKGSTTFLGSLFSAAQNYVPTGSGGNGTSITGAHRVNLGVT